MELERKIKLMEKYDFGFGNLIKGIDSCVKLISKERKTESERKGYVEAIMDKYHEIQDHYDSIDFEELEREMDEQDRDDFQTLFTVRDILPEFKEAIDKYIAVAKENNYFVQKESPEAQKISEIVYQRLFPADKHNGIPFRTRIIHLKELLQGSPAPDY